MSRINRRREVPGSSNEGTSARTRSLSFEEIMLRRKKKLAAEGKERSSTLKDCMVQDDANVTSGHLDADKANKSMKDLRDTMKESSRKAKERPPKLKDVDLETTRKHKLDTDANDKLKSIYTKSSKDKERMNEKHNHHRSRDGDKLRTSSTKELERKQPKLSMIEHNKYDDRERKSRGDMKIKEHGYADEKYRLEMDYSSLRRHDSGKMRHSEYTERNDRRKDGSKPYFEEPKSKRRRSRGPEYVRERGRSISSSPRAHKQAPEYERERGRSISSSPRAHKRAPEYERERGRSISSSPRTHKRSYNDREHEESSYFKDKQRRKHSDGDKQRTSGNGAHYRKHGSGLGGYSPRKRRPEATVRSPSPTIPSPERKPAKWDQPPAESRNSGFGVMPSNVQSSVNKIQEPASVTPVIAAAKIPQNTPTAEIPSQLISSSIDSVQLTQATRPLRSLYVENLPALASERTLVDFLNDLLVSSRVNHIKGSSPCISCILNKEKNQAVVEFLTPQDATSALSFDGRSFSGSLLKIRRPKDFVETAVNVVPEIPKEELKVIADIVKDSPHKIFIGGISEALSADMLMEIVGAFGNLKSYHFEFNQKLNGPCAFLEYSDHSITSKACAGLNGMKLGGCILTVVQALPGAQVEEKAENAPFYDIPAPAKSLLAPPTKVLQLKNVFNNEDFLLLSESELEEVLEDIRLECTRFGTVKAVNIARYSSNLGTAAETSDGVSVKVESRMECSSDSKQDKHLLPPEESISVGISNGVEDIQSNDEMHLKDFKKSVVCGIDGESEFKESQLFGDAASDQPIESEKDVNTKVEVGAKIDLLPETPKISVVDDEMEKDASLNNPENVDFKNYSSNPKEADTRNEAGKHMSAESTSMSSRVIHKEGTYVKKDDVLEPGSVLVEFLREETTCTAAHCLHGRTYGERVVTAGYFPHNIYLARFG
ncbi:hypothetical protein Cni_G18708 [Canna indica]|uniref:RRM domain-containing protein n=1 Tax=Canna indica TaxID=4628 RepID=A0AAQ3KJK0_9LILI|nr:hypothetical protein Cni_G18708 [Canna indica]